MPYANVPESKQDEMKRCVESVMGDGKDEQAAIAICYTSVVEGKALPDGLKYGARNSRGDASRLQMIHDYAVENGAACGDAEKSVDLDSLVTFGASVKALGDGRVGGYLVKFSTANDPDMTGDYFTASTDFGDADKSPVLYHHGLDVKVGKRVIGDATLRRDEVGIWAEAQLKMRDAYEQTIYKLAEAGKLGWSSGTASHLVERKAQGNAQEITRWPLGLDASLTPTPAEPRNSATPIKSLSIPSMLDLPETEQENRSAEQQTANEQPTTKSLGDQAMSEEIVNEIKALADKVNALETTIKSAPPIKTLGNGIEIKDNERPFKSIGDQLMAIKAQATGEITERQYNGLKAVTADHMKATGASEASAVDGGYLLQPEFSNELRNLIYTPGGLLGNVRVAGIGPNSNSKIVNRIDETSRANGSRFGGVLAYWLGEAGTYTASRPKLRQDEVKLGKVTGLYYATDELLQDATALASEVPFAFAEEIRFKVEDAIWEGNGVGMPAGITTSPAVVSVAKEAAQSADTVVYENVIKMYARLFPASQRSNTTAWFVNNDVLPQLNTLVQVGGTAAIPAKFVDWGADGVMRMMGRPVIPIEYASTLGDLYDIMLVDLAYYDAIDKGGLQGASSIHVAFTTGEQVFRWTYRFGGQPKIKSAVTPFKGSNTVSAFVALAERA